MFPGAGAQIHRNDAGEPIGWDYPADDATAFYCDAPQCGITHAGPCPDEYDEDEDDA